MTQQEFQQRYTYNLATDKLGEGGFGSVFKAYDNHLDRWVALKIAKVNPQYESIRLRREVELVAKLPTHPNIARYEECYTFASFDGEYDFGVLQYYEAGNLLQLMSGRDGAGNVAVEQQISILTQILSGLDFLHGQGIIHRDLKPHNILIARRRNGEYIPKITDFGISKQLDVNKSSIFTNSLAGAGTLAYASPEQLGDREIRRNTDLWSFGVIAFQLLTGRLPFTTGEHATTSEAGRMELFRQINSGRLPETIGQIPEPWQALIRRCLITDPAQRLKNTHEAIAVLHGRGEPACSPPTPPADNREIDPLSDSTRIDNPQPPDDTDCRPDTPHPSPSNNSPPPAPATGDSPPKQQRPVGKYLLLAASAAIIIFLLFWGVKIFIVSSNKSITNTLPQNTVPAPGSNCANFTEIANNLNNDMIAVRGGTFTMGCTSEQGDDCYDEEKPAHRVTVSDFYIGKYEVTQAQWKAVMGSNPSWFNGDNLPVEQVSWDDVQEFIRKLNEQTGKQYRLPTEAEWEYAARGGADSRGYKYSGSNAAGTVAWYGDNSGETTHPVGTRSPNELGIYDMSGNVSEWCSDLYGIYGTNAVSNPQRPSSGSGRVLRGGCWYHLTRDCRSASRDYQSPGSSYYRIGFRLALSL